MNFLKWIALAVLALALTACSDNDTSASEKKEQSEVGYELAGGKIVEATNVPDEEKQSILSSFSNYIDAFNEQDVEKYLSTIAETPKGFKLAEERTEVEKVFSTYDVTRTPAEVTIIKYNEKEANVFSNLTIELVEKATGNEMKSSGRQVTVFNKMDGEWKVTSVYYIGNE